MLQPYTPNLLEQSIAHNLLIVEADALVRDVVKLIAQAQAIDVMQAEQWGGRERVLSKLRILCFGCC